MIPDDRCPDDPSEIFGLEDYAPDTMPNLAAVFLIVWIFLVILGVIFGGLAALASF